VAPKISDQSVREAAETMIRTMDNVGTDQQFISPRPYLQMHSVTPGEVTEVWSRHVNDLIARQVAMFPDRLKGVAGLPQFRLEPLEKRALPELKRCVDELGFVGSLVNPDPTEGDEGPRPPGMGDSYWHPLYEALVRYDIPALIHSAGCCSTRESYTLKFLNEESIAIISLVGSDVFQRFPKLKLVVSHGGGAIPYQVGRFRSWSVRSGSKETFDAKLKKLNYDTCLYSKESLELLIRLVGADSVMFGTEKPGTGSARDPESGRDYDDLKPVIEAIDWLSPEDKAKIFEGNARRLYQRAFK
jgi:4-oxalmesaconate hydratase